MSEISSRWDEIKLNIKNEYDLSQVSFDTWIVPLKFYEEKDNVVSILIPSNQSHALNYISDKYNFMSKKQAIYNVHMPIDILDLKKARQRIKLRR